MNTKETFKRVLRWLIVAIDNMKIERVQLLPGIISDAWATVTGALQRTFTCESSAAAEELAEEMAGELAQCGYQPDQCVASGCNVHVRLTTSSIGKHTERDSMAALLVDQIAG